MTLGMTAEMVLGAQTPARRPRVGRQRSHAGRRTVFPGVAGASHDALLQGLGMTPRISQAMPTAPRTRPCPIRRLTGKDRLTLFWNDTYASPGAFAGLSAGALVDQVRHTPAKWDRDGSGYTRRFASEYGQLATRNVIHEGLAGITGLDPRYPVCKCDGTLHRSAHALKMTFTTYRAGRTADPRCAADRRRLRLGHGLHLLVSPSASTVRWCREFSSAMSRWAKSWSATWCRSSAPDMQRALASARLDGAPPSRPDDDD